MHVHYLGHGRRLTVQSMCAYPTDALDTNGRQHQRMGGTFWRTNTMDKGLRDATGYLRQSLSAAFEPSPAPTADDVDASLLNPKLSFWDRDQRQTGAWDLTADVEGPLSD